MSTALATSTDLPADWMELDWKSELRNNVTTVDELESYIPLSKQEKSDIAEVVDHHPMNIPRYYLSLIDPADPDDPIRKLSVPAADELIIAGSMGETTGDPYGDDKHDKGNGILHKYGYSALVVATEYCSMYCRHCFRKRMVGLSHEKTVESFQAASEYIRSHNEITNVIISGGDPLLLPTPVLQSMLDALVDIDHVNYVRIGSRAPVVYPLRFADDELIDLFTRFNRRKTLYLPTHFNSPAEITPEATDAILRIRESGVTINNQAVLLRGVNDDDESLYDLMTGLIRIGVNPYYLYQCMPVTRVRHHFQVPLKRGVDLVGRVKQRLDGYAKRFKFIMGHDIGKIEICGRSDDLLIMSQLHARQGHDDEASRILVRRLNDTGGWLDDLEAVTGLAG